MMSYCSAIETLSDDKKISKNIYLHSKQKDKTTLLLEL